MMVAMMMVCMATAVMSAMPVMVESSATMSMAVLFTSSAGA